MSWRNPDEDAPDIWEARFVDVYNRTYRNTRAYALRRTQRAVDADDVVAETYLVAWRRLDDLLAAREPQAWLYGVAHRVLANQRRTRNRRSALSERARAQPPLEQDSADPASVIVHRDEYERMLAAMGQLSERDQEILRLAAYEELDHHSIGAAIGVRGPLVRTLLYRARRRLNAALVDTGTRQPPAGGHIHSEGPPLEADADGVDHE